MLKILLAAVAALSLATLDHADAAGKRKRHKVRAVPMVTAPAPVMGMRGPSWAGPYECFTDEGYGRYWPCGAGRDQ